MAFSFTKLIEDAKKTAKTIIPTAVDAINLVFGGAATLSAQATKALLKGTEDILEKSPAIKLLGGQGGRSFEDPEKKVQIAVERNTIQKQLLQEGKPPIDAQRIAKMTPTPTELADSIMLAIGFTQFGGNIPKEIVPKTAVKGEVAKLDPLAQAKKAVAEGKTLEEFVKVNLKTDITDFPNKSEWLSYNADVIGKGKPSREVYQIISKAEDAWDKKFGIGNFGQDVIKDIPIKSIIQNEYGKTLDEVNAVLGRDVKARSKFFGGEKIPPIEVLADSNGKIHIVDGRNRLIRAYQEGKETIPAKINGYYNFKKSQLTDFYNQAVKGEAPKVTDELADILNKYKPLRGKQEVGYSMERGKRFAKAEKAYQEIGGVAGYKAGLAKLGGELPKIKVPEKLTQEVQTFVKAGKAEPLFTQIQKTKWMTTGEKTTAQTGLAKALSGQLPTEGELTLLETIFGNKFAESLKTAEPWKLTVWNVLNEVGGTMKVLLSSFGDLSLYARQGVMYATRFPLKGVKLIKHGAVSGVSSKYYDALQNAIRTHEYYPIARRFNVPFTEIGGAVEKLNKVDEQFLVRWIRHIPGIGHVVTATERAFNAMANKARADWFYKLTDDSIKFGYNPIRNPEAFQEASNFVASFTGRANLGEVLNRMTEFNNLLLYSPRLIKSRVDILASPITYLNASPPVRKEVWKTLISYYGAMTTILVGATLMSDDIDIETDWRSTDFLKVRVGKRRWDITGGLQPYLRLIGQMVNSATKSSTTGKIRETNIAKLLNSFLRGKLSPLASTLLDITSGKTFLGEKITAGGLAKDHLVNLIVQDVMEASEEVGLFEALVTTGIPAFFGVGTQTYQTKGGSGIKNYTTSGSSGIKNYAK